MSSEQAGAHPHGTFDREAARDAVRRYLRGEYGPGGEPDLLDALEACVVPDPRLARIEALIDKAWKTMHAGTPVIDAAVLATILRGNE